MCRVGSITAPLKASAAQLASMVNRYSVSVAKMTTSAKLSWLLACYALKPITHGYAPQVGAKHDGCAHGLWIYCRPHLGGGFFRLYRPLGWCGGNVNFSRGLLALADDYFYGQAGKVTNMAKIKPFLKASREAICGTSLQGHVDQTFLRLAETIGKPHHQGEAGDKVCAEWAFVFPDGTVATLYNWKDGKCYLGADGLSLIDITRWNVGGNSPDAVNKVWELIK